MLDATPVTTEITRLISTGTAEDALLAAVAQSVPEHHAGRAVGGAAGRHRRGGAAGQLNESPEHAEKQSAKINKHGGKRTNSCGRRSGAFRKKGSPNKLTANVKAAIMAAFDEVGGADYLKTRCAWNRGETRG